MLERYAAIDLARTSLAAILSLTDLRNLLITSLTPPLRFILIRYNLLISSGSAGVPYSNLLNFAFFLVYSFQCIAAYVTNSL